MPPLQADTFDPNQGLKMAHDSLQKSKVKDRYKVKCVLVGDGATGKTSLILSYSSNAFPTEYVPTAYDTYSVDVTVDSNPVRLEICDTAGQDDFDNLRPLCYPGTDAFLLCFSVVNPTSFHNISEKWAPELRKKYPKIPLILVGTLCDLRGDVRELIQLDRYNERPVTEEEAEAKARDIGALRYIECSALTQKNMKEVFDLTILAGLDKKGVLVSNGKSHSLGLMGSKRWKKYRQHQVTRSAVFMSASSPSNEQIDSLAQLHKRTDLDKNGNGSAADCSSAASVSHGRTKKKRGWKKFCCFS